MAMFALRARRALGSISAVHRSLSGSLPAFPAAPAPVPGLTPSSPSSVPSSQLHSRTFRSSTASLLAQGGYSRNFEDGDKIDPDAIPSDGRDYNHWRILVDFPDDPTPTPEEMVRTFEEICTKGLNISVEEAKKRIYACRTSGYCCFHAVMTEAESEQFRGIPGVNYIFPDAYRDRQKKEYGGDKYENGVITHSPQYLPYKRYGGRCRVFLPPWAIR